MQLQAASGWSLAPFTNDIAFHQPSVNGDEQIPITSGFVEISLSYALPKDRSPGNCGHKARSASGGLSGASTVLSASPELAPLIPSRPLQDKNDYNHYRWGNWGTEMLRMDEVTCYISSAVHSRQDCLAGKSSGDCVLIFESYFNLTWFKKDLRCLKYFTFETHCIIKETVNLEANKCSF